MKFYVQYDEEGIITGTNSLPENVQAPEVERIIEVESLPAKQALWIVKGDAVVKKTKSELLATYGLTIEEFEDAPNDED